MSRLFKIGATAAMGAPDGSPFPISVTDYTQTADWLKYNGFDTMEVHIRAPQMSTVQSSRSIACGSAWRYHP